MDRPTRRRLIRLRRRPWSIAVVKLNPSSSSSPFHHPRRIASPWWFHLPTTHPPRQSGHPHVSPVLRRPLRPLSLRNESRRGERRACSETLRRTRSSPHRLMLSRSQRAKRAQIQAQKRHIKRNRPSLTFCKFFLSFYGSMVDDNDTCVVEVSVGSSTTRCTIRPRTDRSRPLEGLGSPSSTQPSPLTRAARLSSCFQRRTRGETQQRGRRRLREGMVMMYLEGVIRSSHEAEALLRWTRS